MKGQINRLINYGIKFLLNKKYRNQVVDTIERQIKRAEYETGKQQDEILNLEWLSSKSFFMVGGCELTYIKERLEKLGANCYHTFDVGRTVDPKFEIMDPSTELWNRKNHYILLSQVQIFRNLIQKLQSNGPDYLKEDQKKDLDQLINDYSLVIDKIRESFDVPIILITSPLTYRPVYGVNEIFSFKNNFSLIELLKLYELELYELAKTKNKVLILDSSVALERLGKNSNIEDVSADGVYEHFTRQGSDITTNYLLRQLSVFEPNIQRIKCAIFDLDNTLWSGVLREDGPEGVSVRSNIITIMNHLTKRGILIGLCSKNDEVEKEHLPSLLGKKVYEKLVVKYLNWKPKSENLRDISKELNIGLNSIAFFDDNKFEREEVKSSIPEVLVLSDEDILSSLDLIEFQMFGGVISDSTFERIAQYQHQATIKQEEKKYDEESYTEFLKSCNLQIELRNPQSGEISRIVELLQRSNQLNATHKRSSENDLKNYYKKSDKYEIIIAKLKDKFGDYGLIGVIISEKKKDFWEIIELTCSCRAMSRGVEASLITTLSKIASREVGALQIQYIKTDRNIKIREILSNQDFACMKKSDEKEILELNLANSIKSVDEWLEQI